LVIQLITETFNPLYMLFYSSAHSKSLQHKPVYKQSVGQHYLYAL